jgi:hypothetical protein
MKVVEGQKPLTLATLGMQTFLVNKQAPLIIIQDQAIFHTIKSITLNTHYLWILNSSRLVYFNRQLSKAQEIITEIKGTLIRLIECQ